MKKKLILENTDPSTYTYILTYKNYDKIAVLNNIVSPSVNINFIDANELSLQCYKIIDGIVCNCWDELCDEMLLYVKELNEYFSISVSVSDSDSIIKNLTCSSLCHSELSKLKLYDIEINTDIDIEREEYTSPTIFYNAENKNNSLLHRILFDKAPHYQIGHVDESLMRIQRVFSFSDISIYDALTQIATEIQCLFVFDSMARTIEAYDLLSYCKDCKTRGEFLETCDKCKSSNIISGYGNDTTLFISTENNTESVSYEVEQGSCFNFFRVMGGDDIMNSTLKSINPNGSNYIYYFNEDDRKIMPIELIDSIDKYSQKQDDIDKNYKLVVNDNNLITNYDNLVEKYNSDKYASYKYDDENNKVLANNSFTKYREVKNGFSNTILFYYDLIDIQLYLEHSLMPTINNDDIKAENEILKLSEENLSPLGITSVTSSTSVQTVESALKNYIAIFVSARYKREILTESFDYIGENKDGYNECEWIGKIKLTNYNSDDDVATSSSMKILINNNYSEYMEQKIKKALKNNSDDEDESIFDLISLKYSESDEKFKNALTLYSLNRLKSYMDAYQAGLDILVEADQASESADLYEGLYLPYRNRLNSIQIELDIRALEISITDSMVEGVLKENIEVVQKSLDLQSNIGDLWKVFWSYIREDKYENSNYISDGLDNKNIIRLANELMEIAKKEIIKSSNKQYTITTNIANLFNQSKKSYEFIKDRLIVGNWIRTRIDDAVFRCRIVGYTLLSGEESNNIPIILSNSTKGISPISEVNSLMNNVKSMSGTYSYVERQASNGNNANEKVKDWIKNGFYATQQKIINNKSQSVVYDLNGIIVRSYDDIKENFLQTQLKIMNSTIAITDDNWETVKTAIGKFSYFDPFTNEYKTGYGINAETIVGSFILGENLNLYNKSGTLKFDNDGLAINSTRGLDGVYKKLFRLQKDGVDKAYFDDNGNLVINNLIAVDGQFNGNVNITSGTIEIGKNFKVENDGTLKASNGDFTGRLSSSSGNIGSLNINSEGFNYSGRKSIKYGLDDSSTGVVDLSVSFRVPDSLDGSILNWRAHPIDFVTDDLGGKLTVTGLYLGFTGKVFSGFGDITYLDSDTINCGSINVSGTKKRIIDTENYSTRSQYCYEMASPYFGDIGQGETDETGLCYIYLDDIFRETISDTNYYIFLQSYSENNIYVIEKNINYFIVKGAENIKFDWEVKARQKGFEQDRLELHIKDEFVDIDYESNASNELLQYLRGGE